MYSSNMKILNILAGLDDRTCAHSLRVATTFDYDDFRCFMLGLVHDIIEDTEFQIWQLELSNDLCQALDAITKRNGETYADYIDRVVGNPLAIRVKIADLQDNLATMDTEHERLRPKYEAALKRLMKLDAKVKLGE